MERENDNRSLILAAARTHHVLTRAQLHAIGLGDEAIRHRRRTGVLFAQHRDVFAVGREQLPPRGRWLAAVLACGEGAVLAGPSAGALHDLVGGGATIHVAVRGTHGRRLRGVRTRRVALEAWEVGTVDGIAVTSPARTLLDLCAGASPGAIRRHIDRSERLRLYDDRAVRATLAAHPRAPGAARLRAALASYEEPPAQKSALEIAMRVICERARLPTPEFGAVVAGFECDFFWPARGVIVETDGRETHLTRAAFEHDRARDAHHTALGYRVVRFTHRQVLYEPAWVADVLRRVLASPPG